MDAKRIEAIYPVSPFQEMLLSRTAEPQAAGELRGVWSCTLQGTLNPDIFEEAWNQLLGRHPILRTSFVWKRVEKPLQVVHRGLQLAIDRQDWRTLPFPRRKKLFKD